MFKLQMNGSHSEASHGSHSPCSRVDSDDFDLMLHLMCMHMCRSKYVCSVPRNTFVHLLKNIFYTTEHIWTCRKFSLSKINYLLYSKHHVFN